MKKYRIFYLSLIVLSLFTFLSCEEYLDKSERADISDEDVFTDFISFQGFVESMYCNIVDVTSSSGQPPYGWDWGGDMWGSRVYGFNSGDYWRLFSGGGSPLWGTDPLNFDCKRAYGPNKIYYWQNGWANIRRANLALNNLDMMVDATDEERDLIKGQAYFFRAYSHWEMLRIWGNIPYVDQFLSPDSDMKIPPLSFHETAEKVIIDLKKAAELLPLNWDETEAGQATYGANIGRISKGIAKSFIAECLLYCGSPLMNGASTGNYTYHEEYMKRAAEAAWEVIELANQGVYELEDWSTYKDIFARFNRTRPGGKELIFGPPLQRDSRGLVGLVILQHLGGYTMYACPTQNLVDRFEMANGYPYDDPESGYDESKPWDNREPRFYFNIQLDGEKFVQSLNDARAYAQFYVGGRDRKNGMARTGYGQKKYTGIGTNKFDNAWNGAAWTYSVPRLRLAEIYLMYAESVNEAYGPSGRHPGASLTAIDAINIIRNRAQMPDVHAKFTGDKALFRDRIWNERSVELALEGKYWYDTRRWYVAHLPFYTELYEMLFDKGHTYFERYSFFTRTFSMKHYWFPLPLDQVNIYSEWKQNPGW